MKNKILLSFLMYNALWFSCSPTNHIHEDMRPILKQNQKIWLNAAFSNYNFKYGKSCSECAPQGIFWVKVIADTVFSVERDSSEIDGVTMQENIEWVRKLTPTIDGLFEIIQHAIDSDAAILSVEYDSTYGYPIDIQIDYDKQTIDDEVHYFASDLKEQ